MNLYILSTVTTLITFVLFIPFINLLYKLKMQDPIREKSRIDKFGHTVEVFDSIKGNKVGTPTGGGVLVVLVTTVLFLVVYFMSGWQLDIENLVLLLLAYILFGIIGLYDDLKKVFKFKGLALRVRHKLLIQLFASSLIAYWGVSHQLFFITNPLTGTVVNSGILLFVISILIIIFMSNAYNIIDGIDGLSAGSLLITIIPLLIFISNTTRNETNLIFLMLLFGATLAYLYFNINPARIFMGDTGALAFGAIIGLITMTTGTLYLLPLFGFTYIADALTSVLQWGSMYFRQGKRIFKIAPIHHHFEAIGWESTKVVFRFWIVNVFFAVLAIGLFFWVG